MYCDGYDDRFPVVHTGSFSHYHEVGIEWFAPLTEFGYELKYLRCPADSEYDAGRGIQSCMMNSMFTFGNRISSLKRSSFQVVLAERGFESGSTTEPEEHQCYDGMCSPAGWRENIAAERHNRRANYLFADGHAVLHVFAETVPDPDDPATNRHFVTEWAGDAYLPGGHHH